MSDIHVQVVTSLMAGPLRSGQGCWKKEEQKRGPRPSLA
jgi:hypothetical protein